VQVARDLVDARRARSDVETLELVAGQIEQRIELSQALGGR
jgi:hypothetical protein